MNIYITFFAIRNNSKYLNIANGFSFGREKKDNDIDMYFHEGRSSEFIDGFLKKYPSVEKIYCSISYPSELESIISLVDEKWVLGGPLIAGLKAKGIKLPGLVYSGSFENYLGKNSLSCSFDAYFDGLVKKAKLPHVFYNCSIGKGCYWSKCKFCDYRYFDSKGDMSGKLVLRPNISDIIEQLRPLEGSKTTNVHLGLPAVTPNILRSIFQSKRDKRVGLTIFVRADEAILRAFKEYQDPTICKKILFSIGCESLSQFGLDTLNKGTTTENTLELARLILERGGVVVLGIMDHYVFANRQMVKETLESLKKLKEIVKGYPRHRIKFTNNGVTLWPTVEAITEFTDDYHVVDSSGYKRYVANIPKDSEVYNCNREISLALVNSGIMLRGASFVSVAE